MFITHKLVNYTSINRATISEVFSKFSKALEEGNTLTLRELLLPNAQASFSMYGEFEGVEAIIEGLLNKEETPDIVHHYVTNEYIAIKEELSQQSVYLTGLFIHKDNGQMNPFWFGGHYVNSYKLTEGGWEISHLRFDLDWHYGTSPYTSKWKPAGRTLGWTPDTENPKILSELEAPWRVIPESEESNYEEEEVVATFNRYAWAFDQGDFSLLNDIFTEDATINMVPIGEIKGRKNIISQLKISRSGRPTFHHAVEPHGIEIKKEKAKLKMYRLIPFRPTEDTIENPVYGAVYTCNLRKEDGMWKFEQMNYEEGSLFQLK
ncbi:nuclear transport factor 2 family protein [Peribacillus simplex]|uniref:SnoaL-like domain-containing protein n=1 Tax=Peribacillus simplex NBRC 15720 = DSM 1321 TaxID=1349754 RepID=A0A223EBA1_9BACI|nr:nuclear transport factor 2 family protein [Peribacillus simplex]ASS92537.1 hypothetical protein BS1321_00225 [Peribacillus simplex NBRC 15720 = DSM 1321]MEC1400785.1 nuclear transport factor 2 family protein [Peribacillus simplex]MED3912846.1 nuclear transport factor 2 family protein [Peribacillus simplex]